jgi:histidinol-phosphate aminotransferase
MATSRRGFIQLVGLNGLAVAAGGAGAAPASAQTAVTQAPPLGAPGTRSSLLRLSSNENSAGPGPRVMAAIESAFDLVNRYNFRNAHELGHAIAPVAGVSADNVIVGCGSSEILDAACHAFLRPERGLLTARPTFELVADRAERLGIPSGAVPVDSELRLDLTQMADQATGKGLVYVCNPNNPTGTIYGAKDIEAFVEKALRAEPRATILIDEAYHEYVEHPHYKSAVSLATTNPRVIVSRTFSKVYGMAGLRVGYAIGRPETLDLMARYLDASRLSVLSARAAVTALEDPARVASERASNTAARAMTAKMFRDAGYRVVDSEANFIMADVKRDIRVFQQACRNRGIEIARPFPPLLSWARISIGTMDEMRHACEALKGALAEPAASAARLPSMAPYVPRRDGTWAC